MDSSPHVPWSDRAPAPLLTLPVLPEVYKRMYLGLPSHEYGKPRASPTRHDQPVKSDAWVELERQVSEIRSQGSRALVNREWSSASAFLVEALQLEPERVQRLVEARRVGEHLQGTRGRRGGGAAQAGVDPHHAVEGRGAPEPRGALQGPARGAGRARHDVRGMRHET